VRRGKFLEPGDVVRVEIDGMGAIEHPIVAAQLSQESADG
jgi:2-keto-4-pentenoate hydratase/2-oxohepta-3-ene-1,7-dioic acid hydratase in catechol pathway